MQDTDGSDNLTGVRHTRQSDFFLLLLLLSWISLIITDIYGVRDKGVWLKKTTTKLPLCQSDDFILLDRSNTESPACLQYDLVVSSSSSILPWSFWVCSWSDDLNAQWWAMVTELDIRTWVCKSYHLWKAKKHTDFTAKSLRRLFQDISPEFFKNFLKEINILPGITVPVDRA